MWGKGLLAGAVGLILGAGLASPARGSCTVDADCNDGIFCTLDRCFFNNCTNVHNDGQCNDGLFCNGEEFCDTGADACVSGNPPTCPEGQFCSTVFDRCVECDGDAQCDDGLFCNGAETCDLGLCTDAAPVDCSFLNTECILGICDEVLNVCVQGLPCDDGNLCTNDICDVGVGCDNPPNYTVGVECCNPSTGVTTIIDDADACTTDSCNAQTGQVTHAIITCDDADPCTIDDVCINNGAGCAGTDVNTILCSEDPDCPQGVCRQLSGLCTCTSCSGAPECNDAIPCTVDTCVDGVCSNVADDGACDTGLFCAQQICDRELGCVLEEFCTTLAGNPCPNAASCNDVADSCGCLPPTVAVTSRYITITPPASGATDIGFFIKGDCLDSAISCVGKYVDFDDPPQPGDPTAARLVGTAVYQTAAAWGTLDVRANELRPGTYYFVHTECSPGAVQSDGVLVQTWRYGDTDGGGEANFTDISREVDAFRGLFSPTLTLEETDLTGEACIPGRSVNFSDISDAVDAFRTLPLACSAVCP